ncbi:DEAD/DEAH box helicase [Pseudalkalibacillus caeni]|uniref:DEAD/DEAH box helicase n=1 Tax=Exobacillus caeni TaxID=2574798 RepID=A0A5R9EZ65_9BACL|nr:DEAD/DEAH box helicase [Pseudalkalibacillus caeni]TLS35380.1 DEAD/DEAH box helicase [Pseudalkalibacillus caeni]
MGFIELGVKEKLLNKLAEQRIVNPSPVQERTIPVLLEGKDTIVQAQTGTGKTIAFLIPILQQLDRKKNHVQALILAPTRELSLQISSEMKKLVPENDSINILPVYGGQSIETQLSELEQNNIHVVIGTPGRILDHFRRETIQLSRVSKLVLDEADQMLQMGFLPEVEEIITKLPTSRQTMLFSATMPGPIRSIARDYMENPETIIVNAEKEQLTVKDIKQIVIETTDREKQATLFKTIDQFHPYLAIIFCRTKRRAKKLNEAMKESGYSTEEFHGDLSQAKREHAVEQFRNNKVQFLIATDVAARGLDIEGVTHVFNYDIPQDTESYVHRIGRTGRAGGKGLAVTFVAPRDTKYLELIEKGLHKAIKRSRLELPKKTDETKEEDRNGIRNSYPGKRKNSREEAFSSRRLSTPKRRRKRK